MKEQGKNGVREMRQRETDDQIQTRDGFISQSASFLLDAVSSVSQEHCYRGPMKCHF
jgi:hypothetical protein